MKKITQRLNFSFSLQFFSRVKALKTSIRLVYLVTLTGGIGFSFSYFVQAHEIPTTVSSPIPLVFIHGVKGASLVNEQGTTHWINLWGALGLKNPSLSLPLAWDYNQTQFRDHLVAGTILDQIVLIPYLAKTKIYHEWLRAVQSFNRPSFNFAYDWRRDNLENLENFKAFIQEISSQSKSKVQIVAHSMGGLITFPLLNQSPELIHSVFFVGVPFVAGIGYLPDLSIGETVGLNHSILAPEILGTFPSSYCFFPTEATDKLIRDDTGQSLLIDFLSPSEWKKNQWGLFAHGAPMDKEKEVFLKTAFAHVRSFRSLLVAQNRKYPPITVVRSSSFPTTVQGKKKLHDHQIVWDFDTLDKCKGDKRVCDYNALPPVGVPYEIQNSVYEHSALLDDPQVIRLIKDSVL